MTLDGVLEKFASFEEQGSCVGEIRVHPSRKAALMQLIPEFWMKETNKEFRKLGIIGYLIGAAVIPDDKVPVEEGLRFVKIEESVYATMPGPLR